MGVLKYKNTKAYRDRCVNHIDKINQAKYRPLTKIWLPQEERMVTKTERGFIEYRAFMMGEVDYQVLETKEHKKNKVFFHIETVVELLTKKINRKRFKLQKEKENAEPKQEPKTEPEPEHIADCDFEENIVRQLYRMEGKLNKVIDRVEHLCREWDGSK